LDQLPSVDLALQFFQQIQAPDFVGSGQSRMAAPHVDAVWIVPDEAKGPPEAFIDEAEFCHVHTAGGGFCHLTLPPGICEAVKEQGWAELHLLVGGGTMPETVHLVYAPRDLSELEILMRIVRASRDFARGLQFT